MPEARLYASAKAVDDAVKEEAKNAAALEVGLLVGAMRRLTPVATTSARS